MIGRLSGRKTRTGSVRPFVVAGVRPPARRLRPLGWPRCRRPPRPSVPPESRAPTARAAPSARPPRSRVDIRWIPPRRRRRVRAGWPNPVHPVRRVGRAQPAGCRQPTAPARGIPASTDRTEGYAEHAEAHPHHEHGDARRDRCAVEEGGAAQQLAAGTGGSSWPISPAGSGSSSGADVTPDQGLPRKIINGAATASPGWPNAARSPTTNVERASTVSAMAAELAAAHSDDPFS